MVSSLWTRCVKALKYKVPDNIFTMWIRPLSAYEQDNQLIVTVPNEYFATYVKKNHLAQIQSLISQLEPEKSIQVQVQIDKVVSERVLDSPLANANENHINLVEKQKKNAASFQYLDPQFTFEQFVSGKSNQLAYSVCKDVV